LYWHSSVSTMYFLIDSGAQIVDHPSPSPVSPPRSGTSPVHTTSRVCFRSQLRFTYPPTSPPPPAVPPPFQILTVNVGGGHWVTPLSGSTSNTPFPPLCPPTNPPTQPPFTRLSGYAPPKPHLHSYGGSAELIPWHPCSLGSWDKAGPRSFFVLAGGVTVEAKVSPVAIADFLSLEGFPEGPPKTTPILGGPA